MSFPHNENESRPTGMHAVIGLIVVSTIAFLYLEMNPRLEGLFVSTLSTLLAGEVWRPISSLFVNSSGFVLFIQMIMLLSFGVLIARNIDWSKLLALYLVCGVVGNLFISLLFWQQPNFPVAGCDGAVYGLIFASAMIAPEYQCYLLFIPFPVKMKTMALVFLLIDLIFFRYQAVGGCLGAYLFMRFFMKKDLHWDPLSFLKKGKENKEEPVSPPPASSSRGRFVIREEWTAENEEEALAMKEKVRELERIMEKFNREGTNSLTPEEFALLRSIQHNHEKRLKAAEEARKASLPEKDPE